jgi:uncharacterized protein (TIGR00255 family)
MSVRSMTGYAQVKGQAGESAAFTLALKAVNHRYLDLHFRMPAETGELEIKLRQMLKEKLARGHVDVTLSLQPGSGVGLALNRELVAGYLEAFRSAAKEFGVGGEPDLNAVLRMQGALNYSGSLDALNGDMEAAVLASAQQAIVKLGQMRSQEGAGLEWELRERMQHLLAAVGEIETLRPVIARAQLEKMHSRMKELLGSAADGDRVLQEAALLAERSDVQEEIVRMKSHVQHFLETLQGGGEAGKKLDFLLQEMSREANTMLSKTAGVAGEGLRLTELGLAMKAEIEKAREQAQNIE